MARHGAAAKFQSLIGLILTENRTGFLSHQDSRFQSLIGLILTYYENDFYNEPTLFQSLIGLILTKQESDRKSNTL